MSSLVGSMIVGALLCALGMHSVLFAILPVWLAARMACASLDGTLAIEFGRKSRLGGILNEAGDIVSEVALILPLAFVAPLPKAVVIALIVLVVMSELAGIAGAVLSRERRLEGPLGKADRSIVLSIIAVFGRLPESASDLVLLLCAGSILTIWNRIRVTLTGAAHPFIASSGHK